MKEIESAVALQCESLVTCNICKDKFYTIDDSGNTKIPKVLECQHSFCDLCLKAYFRSGVLLTSVFACPTCRKSNMWPLKGVDAFPTDRKAKLILELMENLKEAPSLIEEGPLCKVCAENKVDRKGDFFCIEDMQMLCRECFNSHRSSKVLGHHKFIELATGDIIQHNPSNKPLCKQHRLILSYTCTTCNVNLCQCCLFSHPKHQFVMADTLARSDSTTSSSSDFLKFQEDIDMAKKRLEGVVSAEKVIDKGLEVAKDAVDRTYKEARSELDKSHASLLQEVKDRKTDLNKFTVFKKKLALKIKEAEKVLEKTASEKKKDKVDNQLKALVESLNEEAPVVKKLVFREEMVVRMGGMVEEGLQANESGEEASHLSGSMPSVSSVHSSEASGVDSVFTERLKDAVIESLKVNTIMRKDQGQSSRMVESIKAVEGSLWKVDARCKSCCFACKGRVLVMLDASEREVLRQLKMLRSSDGGQTHVRFELGSELINHLIDLNVDKNSLYLLCSSTSQHTLFKKFKLDLTSRQFTQSAKESIIKCYESTNLDLLEGNIIDPVGFALKKNTLAILANKGLSLHLFSTKFKPLARLTSGEFGRSNYVELDEKGNVYVSDVGRGEIRVFDRSGQIKSNFSYMGQGGVQMAPQGIRVDEKGCILLVDQAIATVSLYDANNRLLNHVVENVPSSLALAYSSERHVVVVSDHDSLQAFKI